MSFIRTVLADRHRQRAVKRLSAYLDGEMSERERRSLEDHLEDCEDCRQQLRGLEATIDVVHQLPAMPVPRSFVLAPGRLALRERPAPRILGLLRVATAVAAAAFVVALSADVGLWFLAAGGPTASPSPAHQTPLAASAPTLAAGLPTLGPAEEGSLEEAPVEEPAEELAEIVTEIPAQKAAPEEPPVELVEDRAAADEAAPTDAEGRVGAGEPEMEAAPSEFSLEAEEGAPAARQEQAVQPEDAPKPPEPTVAAKSVRLTPVTMAPEAGPEEAGGEGEPAPPGAAESPASDGVSEQVAPNLAQALRWAEVAFLALFVILLAATLAVRRSRPRPAHPSRR